MINDEQVKAICDYIKLHRLQETDFETIDVAVYTITGHHAARERDLVNPDDEWLFQMSGQDEDRFVGFTEGGGAYTDQEAVSKIESALKYAKEHPLEERQAANQRESIEELKKMKEVLNDYRKEGYTPDGHPSDRDDDNGMLMYFDGIQRK